MTIDEYENIVIHIRKDDGSTRGEAGFRPNERMYAFWYFRGLMVPMWANDEKFDHIEVDARFDESFILDWIQSPLQTISIARHLVHLTPTTP
ncbi:MAG: hypothetical protein ABH880_02780 [Patescibacteria group bacterium]